MKRRTFLTSAGAAGAGLATAGIAAPAIAQSQPTINWRMASSFAKSTDILFGTSELVCRRISEATDGKFNIRPFPAGEIVPGLQVLDAVQNATVQCGHTCGYYYVGKDPTFALDTAVPFGPNARQMNSWVQAGGLELLREFMAGYNVINFAAGNTGAQMGGWFRKEIKSLEDFNGLKMRIAGLTGQIMAKLGATPTQIAAPDVYPALEKGTIDATEFVGPYDDERLGFHQVAKYYYYPGWWEGGPQVSIYANKTEFEALPKSYQAIFQAACAEGNTYMTARYDAENSKALRRLVGKGALLRAYPRDLMEAAYKLSQEMYADLSAQNPNFKKIYGHMKPFMDETNVWFRVAELPFDNFMQSMSARR